MFTEKLYVHFPRNLVQEPILCNVTRQFDITFNIISARITENEEGVMKVELRGARPKVLAAVNYMKKKGLVVRSLSKFVTLDRALCTDCGACVVHCPTAALYFGEEREVLFDPKKCIACELCRPACPYHAVIVAHGEEAERV
ncbi:MAG: NIL domain-containing protein [Planctomycetota bacterium]